MKLGRVRLILFGFALVIVSIGFFVLMPYFQARLREFERINRVTISKEAENLPEIVVRIMTDNVGIDIPYTITSAQRTPNPEGFFEGPRDEVWCISADPAINFLHGPQKNYIAMYIGERPDSLLTYDSGWVLYPFEVTESMFDAMGCAWAD